MAPLSSMAASSSPEETAPASQEEPLTQTYKIISEVSTGLIVFFVLLLGLILCLSSRSRRRREREEARRREQDNYDLPPYSLADGRNQEVAGTGGATRVTDAAAAAGGDVAYPPPAIIHQGKTTTGDSVRTTASITTPAPRPAQDDDLFIDEAHDLSGRTPVESRYMV